MALVYEDHPIRMPGSTPFKPERFNATVMYLRHFENSLVLKFYHLHGTVFEKSQAQKELLICERKQVFWQRQKNYNHAEALKGLDNINRRYGEVR